MAGKIFTHTLNYVFLGLFILSVLVQYNDPDPVPWMLLYGFGAGNCLLYAMGRLRALVSLLTGAVALVWSAWLLPSVINGTETLTADAVFATTHMINERVEIVREIGGLWITFAWMMFLSILVKFSKVTARASG